jgi:hypothetical protein
MFERAARLVKTRRQSRKRQILETAPCGHGSVVWRTRLALVTENSDYVRALARMDRLAIGPQVGNLPHIFKLGACKTRVATPRRAA